MTKILSVYLALVMLCALISPASSQQLKLELPADVLAKSAVSVGSVATSSSVGFNEMGLKRLRRLRGLGAVVEDPQLNQWIQNLGQRLVNHSRQPNQPFYFVILKSNDTNAFASQGGLIGVNAGLILRSDNESELAGVMAHEIAHITQQHVERMIAREKRSKVGTAAAVIAGLVVGSQDAQAGQAILTSGLAVGAHNSLSFSRTAETEADNEGLRILSSAGFDPAAMTSFLRKLGGGVDPRYAGIGRYLSSHPLNSARINSVGQQAQRYARFKGQESTSYQYMRERLRVLADVNAVNRNTRSAVRQYGLAFKKLRDGRASVNALKKPVHAEEILLNAAIYNKQGTPQKALSLLESSKSRLQGSEAGLTERIKTLVGLGQYEKAWALLSNPDSFKERSSVELFELRQDVAQKTRRTGQAYYSIAERNIRQGQYRHALVQIDQARKLTNLSAVDRRMLDRAFQRARRFQR